MKAAVLLRAINLGAKNRVAMADLRALLVALGYEDVQTVLQSGNAVLTTAQKPGAVQKAVERGIEERFGQRIDVLVRTGAQLAKLVRDDPLRDVATNPSRHHVAFLSRAPDAAALRALAQRDFAPERFEAAGREIHAWCPGGTQGSALFRALGAAKLAPVATVRNWNTVTKLAERTAA